MFSRYLPFYTLLKKEVLRFLAAGGQTLLAPLVTAGLFLLVFGVNLGNKISFSDKYTYVQFVVPGLVLMGVINNAFQNSSSSLFFSRYLGNIVDILVTPLSAAQMIMGYTLAAILRGLVVGGATLAVSRFFTPLPWAHPLLAFAMAVLTSLLMSQFGIIAAIYSDSFEAISVYTNFLLLPLTFLGGMFYPISTLPPTLAKFSHFNPLFYTIDGFRHAVLGTGDLPLATSFAVTAGCAVILFAWAALLINHGHKLRQ